MIYGHGIGGQVTSFANFLKNVASHGFVIIGVNVLNGGPNSPANNTAMTNGLNWLLQQNTTAGSKYQGKLLVKRASSMGYSVGGTAAVDIGGHEAIITVVSIHGHISTATLHGTLLQTSGTRDNVGLPMQQQTFTNSKVQTFLGTVTNADHGYIQQNNGGVQRPAIVAWLRYWIYNDAGGRNYFYGNDCVMCKAPWENPQRKNWQ
jgi:predicted dienelactone hydrolase